jgi:aerobic carbon-monoxide dehydrogenase medium subunit
VDRDPGGGAVIPVAFDYVAVGSAEEAVAALAQHGDDAKLLAGGMSLIPLMKLRLATPSVLVDVGRVSDLSYIRDVGDHVAIGALARHHDLATSEVLARDCGVLAAVAAEVGDPQVRHRGTLGGSVAHGDPASDLPAVLLALDATVVARGSAGERTIPAADLFVDFLETSLQPDEMLTEIRVPKTGPNGFSYQKFNRRAQDWATVGALAVRTNGATHVALVNMGGTPLRATAVENALIGGSSINDAADLAADGTDPPDDLSATPAYREHLARVLVRRALETASA